MSKYRFRDSKALTKALVAPIRRAVRYSAIKKWAREEHGDRCVDCGSTESIEMDHDPPVVELNRLTWEMTPLEYFRNTFCLTEDGTKVDLSKLVPRCRSCHQAVTKQQAAARAASRKERGISLQRRPRRKRAKKAKRKVRK